MKCIIRNAFSTGGKLGLAVIIGASLLGLTPEPAAAASGITITAPYLTVDAPAVGKVVIMGQSTAADRFGCPYAGYTCSFGETWLFLVVLGSGDDDLGKVALDYLPGMGPVANTCPQKLVDSFNVYQTFFRQVAVNPTEPDAIVDRRYASSLLECPINPITPPVP